MHGQGLINEVKRVLTVDSFIEKGLVFIDFGVYFPYINQDSLNVNVGIADFDETRTDLGIGNCNYFEDATLNRRYPNKWYLTFSKQNGKKICKYGYFINDSIENLNGKKWLLINYGIDGLNKFQMAIPIEINLTETNCATSITIHLNLKNPDAKISIETNPPCIESGDIKYWDIYHYLFPAPEEPLENYDSLLELDENLTNNTKNLMVYNPEKPIALPSCNYDNVMVG